MVWLKSCPRCNGDLSENQDLYGRYVTCVQCAYYLSEVEEVVLKYSMSVQVADEVEKVLASSGSARWGGRAA